MWMESSNKVYGRTNNPYHVGRIPGGSSGGEGAILSAAGSPMGIGSDVGGTLGALDWQESRGIPRDREMDLREKSRGIRGAGSRGKIKQNWAKI